MILKIAWVEVEQLLQVKVDWVNLGPDHNYHTYQTTYLPTYLLTSACISVSWANCRVVILIYNNLNIGFMTSKWMKQCPLE